MTNLRLYFGAQTTPAHPTGLVLLVGLFMFVGRWGKSVQSLKLKVESKINNSFLLTFSLGLSANILSAWAFQLLTTSYKLPAMSYQLSAMS
jgi:hypothetical protein